MPTVGEAGKNRTDGFGQVLENRRVLKERFEILLDNWMTIVFDEDLTPKIAPIPYEKEPHWMEIQTHVLEECALRRYPYPGPLGYPKHKGFIEKVNFEARQEAFKRTGLEKGAFKLGMA